MFGRKGSDDFFEHLRARGLMGEREVRQAEAQARGMAFADLDRVRIAPQTVAFIPAELARELRALSVQRDGGTLWVAFDTPSEEAVRRIKAATGMRVIPVMCAPAALDDALARL